MNSMRDSIEENLFDKWWKIDAGSTEGYYFHGIINYSQVFYVYPWRWSRSISGFVCHFYDPERDFFLDEYKMAIGDWLFQPFEKPEKEVLDYLQPHMAKILLEVQK